MDKYKVLQDLPEDCPEDPELLRAQLETLGKLLLLAPAGTAEYIYKFLDRHSNATSEQTSDREKRFFSTFEIEIVKKLFPGADIRPGTKETGYFIGLIDGAKEISFPVLRKEAAPGATFSEAAGIDPEYTKTQPLLMLQEMLWNELYLKAAPADQGAAGPELERITVRRPDNVEWPLDKLSSSIWNILEDANGQLTFAMEAKRGSRNTRQTLDCIYSIDFSALEQEGVKITRRLTPFDKRVYIAVSALYNMGNKIITLRQIFYAMGQKASNPKGSQLQKINESLTKMTWARVNIDDRQEHNRYNYNLDEGGEDHTGWRHGRYDGSFLPMERAAAIANGKVTEAAVHLFREPPMLSFAKMRNQITTIDIKLLQSPVSKTDSNLAIEDYLITRLSRARKAGKDFEKILFKTLFEKTGIVEKNQRKRAPGKIEKYLQFYEQESGWITSYTIDRDSVTVYFKGEPEKAAGADPDKQPDQNQAAK